MLNWEGNADFRLTMVSIVLNKNTRRPRHVYWFGSMATFRRGRRRL